MSAVETNRPDEDSSAASPGKSGHSPRAGRTTPLVIVLHLVWSAVLLWALVVVAMNVFFSTKLLARVASSSPDSIVLDYQRVRSFWPGRVHVEGFHLRGQDDNVQWALDVDDADATVVVTDLLRKTFHASRARASGVKFRVRRRLPAASFEGDPRYLAALPPIDDLPTPPLSPDPPTPPVEGADLSLWKVEIDDAVVTHATEIWVDDHVADGDGDITGSFALAPTSSLSVGPAHLISRGLTVRAGHVPVVENLLGDIFASVGPVDLQTAGGPKILNFVSAEVRGKGTVPNLDVVNYYARHTDLAVSGGKGTLSVDLLVERGALQPGAVLALESKGISASVLGLEALFDLETKLKVGPEAAHLDSIASGVHVRTDKNVPLLQAETVGVDIDLGTRAFDRLATKPGMALDAPDLQIPHIETWNALAASPAFDLVGGDLRGRVHLEFEPVWTTGRGELALRGPVSVTCAKTRIDAGVSFDAKVPSFDLAERKASLTGGRAELRDVRVAGQSDGPWWGRVEIERGDATWKAAPHASMDLVAQSLDARPVLLFLADQGSVPGWVHTVLTLGNARAKAKLAVGATGVDLEDLSVAAAELDAQANVHAHGGRPRSCVLLTSGPFAVGVDGRGASSSLVLLGAKEWFSAAAPCR